MIGLEFFVLPVLGLVVGVFGTMVGIGGGFLVVPILIVAFGFEPRIAVGTSLVYVFFNALSGSLGYLKQKRVNIHMGLMFAILTIPGSILGAYVTGYFKHGLFQVVFAILLVATSLYLVIRPIKEKAASRLSDKHTNDVKFEGKVYNHTPSITKGLIISFCAGFVSSIFGVGGGILHVPTMIFLLEFPVHISTATSHFIIIFSSILGSLSHASLGNVKLDFALLLALGGIFGAQLGALVSQKTKGTTTLEQWFGKT